MDTYLQYGDHGLSGRGMPYSISGTAELLQRAWIRLIVKRGSFSLDPTLGSDLYKLKRTGTAQLEQAALACVQQALYPIKALTVEGIQCSYDSQADRLTIQLELRVGQDYETLEVRL